MISSARVLTILAVFAIALPGTAQVSDTTPPALVSLSFPASVDVTSGPQNVPVIVHATDDLSGVQQACVYFGSPSGRQNRSNCAGTGNASLNATLTITVPMPQFSEAGNWKVESVFLRDNAGNNANLDTQILQARGFPTVLAVTSTPDTTPPTLVSLSLSQNSIDVSNGPKSFQVNLGLTDDVSGVDYGCQSSCYYSIFFRSPSSRIFIGNANYNFAKISGTPLNGIWQTTMMLPQFSEAGTWAIASVYFYDQAGNGSTLSTLDLQNLHFPTSLTVSSNPSDITPPTLTGLSLPSLIDTSASAQTASLTLTATDDLSGLDFFAGYISPHFINVFVYVQSPSGGQSQNIGAYSNPFHLVSGTTKNGTWTTQFTMPQYSEAGTWTVAAVQLEDAAHNLKYLNTSDLVNLGINPNFDVVQGSQTVDGTISGGTGGTVNDQTFGSRASITVPPGIINQNTNVSIDVLQSNLSIPTPQGYSGPGTAFVNITLSPTPHEPFPAPGLSITIPVINNSAPPGAVLQLYRVDSTTGHLIPEQSVNAPAFVTGTVASDGLSATFHGLASLSTVVGLMPTGAVIGDVNGDRVVNCADVSIVKTAFGKRRGQTGYDARADLNNDGVIDINDLSIVLRHLPNGTVCH